MRNKKTLIVLSEDLENKIESIRAYNNLSTKSAAIRHAIEYTAWVTESFKTSTPVDNPPSHANSNDATMGA